MAETGAKIASAIIRSLHHFACSLLTYPELLLPDKYNRWSDVSLWIRLALGQIKHLLDQTGAQPIDPRVNLIYPVICKVQ